MTRTVVFVCEHGAFRSRIAAAYFNAAPPKGWRATSAGRDPQAEPSARLGSLLAGTAAAGHVETEPPPSLLEVDAARLIAIDCSVEEADVWHTTAGSDEALRDELSRRIALLVRELERTG